MKKITFCETKGSQKVVTNCHKRDPKSDKMPVISSKHLIPGDVVFKCKPLMVWNKYKYKGKHCDNCLKPMDQLMKCSKCLQMYYCDRNCQSIDWSFHKNECKVFRKKTISEFHPISMPFLRLYLRIKNDKTFATERHTLFDGSDVCLNDLKSKVNVKSILVEIFAIICKQFGVSFDAKELLQWYGLMCKTRFCLNHAVDANEPRSDSMSEALYLQVLPISHSCSPNMAFVRKDDSLEIRAIKSIAIGEELTMSWIGLHMNRNQRRRELSFSFTVCQCRKCRLHLDKDMDYEDFNQLLDEQKYFWMSSKFAILRHQYIEYQMDSNFMLYLDAMYGEFHPIVTHFLLESFMCFANNSSNRSLIKLWFKRIERHVLVTHGSDHPWYELLRYIFDKSLEIIFL